nr:MAG TPA: rubisco-like protein [Caudoviricetes sp.]
MEPLPRPRFFLLPHPAGVVAAVTSFRQALRSRMDGLSIEERKHYWTSVLIRAQETLAESIGRPGTYFKADQEIRQARRELRRLEKGGK